MDAALAVADPIRRRVLELVRDEELPAGEIAAQFAVSRPAVSRHLSVLERAGLIARGRTAQLRPSRLQGAALKEAADWLADYSAFWEESFDRLGEELRGDGAG